MQSLKVMLLKNYGYKKMHKNIHVTKVSGTARCKKVYTANIQCLQCIFHVYLYIYTFLESEKYF